MNVREIIVRLYNLGCILRLNKRFVEQCFQETPEIKLEDAGFCIILASDNTFVRLYEENGVLFYDIRQKSATNLFYVCEGRIKENKAQFIFDQVINELLVA